MGFLMGHSAWQIDQFPTCWPMNGLFVHWSRGWGVSSFSERLVYKTCQKTKRFPIMVGARWVKDCWNQNSTKQGKYSVCHHLVCDFRMYMTLIGLCNIWDSFHWMFKSFWLKSCEKYYCTSLDSNDPVRSQICICHDSWAVVACANLWPDLIAINHVRMKRLFTRCGIWVL